MALPTFYVLETGTLASSVVVMLVACAQCYGQLLFPNTPPPDDIESMTREVLQAWDDADVKLKGTNVFAFVMFLAVALAAVYNAVLNVVCTVLRKVHMHSNTTNLNSTGKVQTDGEATSKLKGSLRGAFQFLSYFSSQTGFHGPLFWTKFAYGMCVKIVSQSIRFLGYCGLGMFGARTMVADDSVILLHLAWLILSACLTPAVYFSGRRYLGVMLNLLVDLGFVTTPAVSARNLSSPNSWYFLRVENATLVVSGCLPMYTAARGCVTLHRLALAASAADVVNDEGDENDTREEEEKGKAIEDHEIRGSGRVTTEEHTARPPKSACVDAANVRVKVSSKGSFLSSNPSRLSLFSLLEAHERACCVGSGEVARAREATSSTAPLWLLWRGSLKWVVLALWAAGLVCFYVWVVTRVVTDCGEELSEYQAACDWHLHPVVDSGLACDCRKL